MWNLRRVRANQSVLCQLLFWFTHFSKFLWFLRILKMKNIKPKLKDNSKDFHPHVLDSTVHHFLRMRKIAMLLFYFYVYPSQMHVKNKRKQPNRSRIWNIRQKKNHSFVGNKLLPIDYLVWNEGYLHYLVDIILHNLQNTLKWTFNLILRANPSGLFCFRRRSKWLWSSPRSIMNKNSTLILIYQI